MLKMVNKLVHCNNDILKPHNIKVITRLKNLPTLT